jgi:hypothetical protein
MEPAIRLARDGYALSWNNARIMTEDKVMAQFPDSKRIFQNDGKGWHQNDLFKQPELARTLERIAAAPDDFYTGKMAHELADFIQKGGGLITAEDLAHYEVKDREPVRGTYRGPGSHQRAAAVLGRHRADRNSQHPRGLRPGQGRASIRPSPCTSSPRPIGARSTIGRNSSATRNTTTSRSCSSPTRVMPSRGAPRFSRNRRRAPPT